MIRYTLVCLLTTAFACEAQSLSVLTSFMQATGAPNGPFFQGADGNFYGTTDFVNGPVSGPIPTGGIVFKMTPAGALTTLYTNPASEFSSLVLANDGNLYGGTNGPIDNVDSRDGTIFKLTPAGAISILHAFSGPDGVGPTNLIQGTDGNLYGTTPTGGASQTPSSNGDGTVFRISLDGTFATLHSFSGPDGNFPGKIIQASDGNIYGSTMWGGSGNCPADTGEPAGYPSGCGTVFQITPAGSFTLLHSFNASDGAYPNNLISANDGNLYSTTQGGGSIDNCTSNGSSNARTGCGTFFKITPTGSLTTILSFNKPNLPSLLLQASDGNFYGISESDTIVQVTTAGVQTSVYTFCLQSACLDGAFPKALTQGADGNLYGTTASGGENSYYGTVFKFSLASNVPAIAATGGVLNGASFQPGIAAGSWITISGTNLSPKTDTWNSAIINGALPTTLDGVSVMVGDQPAYVEYVSATQINALAPDVPAGTVPVTVTNPNGTSQAVMTQLSAEQPAFFQWGNYAVATRQDFSLAVKNGTFPGTTTVPAAPGDVIILWGTGFGPTSPTAPAGMETPSSTTYNTANAVSVTLGNQPATVYGAALAPGYAGLYQVAIQIPASLDNGDYPVVATIAGAQSPSTTLITVQQ
jgi:uncharacterized protein (TIGR03437 family)